MEGSVHRCPLPPPAFPFNSTEGKKLFHEAMLAGHMEGYFLQAEHFLTQGNTGFCGLGSLTMALNTLLIDPNKVYSVQGTSMMSVACLARCNGLNVELIYGHDSDLETFRQDVKRVSSQSKDYPPHVLLVSYSREALGQLGVGHFSPIGGYHAESDQVLILDVARFKYPPHWLPLQLVFEAMKPLDTETGLSRGYLILTASNSPRHQHCGDKTPFLVSSVRKAQQPEGKHVLTENDDIQICCEESKRHAPDVFCPSCAR
eukprot:scaffold634_cov185-Ochromonas_danica.AAC.6